MQYKFLFFISNKNFFFIIKVLAIYLWLYFAARRNIYLDTQHAESWAKIQEIENYEPPREPSPELSFPPPTFTVPLQVCFSYI